MYIGIINIQSNKIEMTIIHFSEFDAPRWFASLYTTIILTIKIVIKIMLAKTINIIFDENLASKKQINPEKYNIGNKMS